MVDSLTSFSFYANVTSLERTLLSTPRQQPHMTIRLPCVIFLHSRYLLWTLNVFAYAYLLVYKLVRGWGFMVLFTVVSMALRMVPDTERLSINISWMNDMTEVYHQMSYSFSPASSWLPQCPMLSSSWESNLITHLKWLAALKCQMPFWEINSEETKIYLEKLLELAQIQTVNQDFISPSEHQSLGFSLNTDAGSLANTGSK